MGRPSTKSLGEVLVSMELPRPGAPDLLLAIDPGPEESGWVVCHAAPHETGELEIFGKGCLENAEIRYQMTFGAHAGPKRMLIECPAPRGKPTASEEMETLIQIGRFVQLWGEDAARVWSYVLRREAKSHLTGMAHAKDANVRQALIDRFGGQNSAVGGKRCDKCKGKGWSGRDHAECGECREHVGWKYPPGCLHGFADHAWAALALACWWVDVGRERHEVAGKQPKKSKQAEAQV